MEALSIGLPVVTLPSSTHVGGRFALALYHMLGYGYQSYDATAISASEHTASAAANDDNSADTTTERATGRFASTAATSSLSEDSSTEQTTDSMGGGSSSSGGGEVSYSPLVVSSVQEYINLALKLTHQPRLRQFHSERILRQRHRLFQQDPAALQAQWKLFAHLALQNATQRADFSDTLQHSDHVPDLLEIPVDLAAPPPPLLDPTRVPTFHAQYQHNLHHQQPV